MEDNDMRLSYLKDGLFSVICGDQNCSRRATVRLGIEALIANILVMLVKDYSRE